MLPVVGSTLRHFGQESQEASEMDPSIRKALKRLRRVKKTQRGGLEEGAVFKVGHCMLCAMAGE
jgi:hypothetical protein